MYLIASQNIYPFFTFNDWYCVVDDYNGGYIVYDDDNEPHFLSKEFSEEMFCKIDVE